MQIASCSQRAAEFQELLSRFPQVYTNAEAVFECQTMELVNRLREITEYNVPQRLAYGLLRLRDQIGQEVNDFFELDVTQETVAQMTEMNVSTANRQLSKWEKLGLVTCVRNTIAIRHHVSLSDLCTNTRGVPNPRFRLHIGIAIERRSLHAVASL